MIKAVIFDMNGVIIDDELVHEIAFKQICANFKIKVTHQIYLRCCVGRTDAAGFEEIFKNHKIKMPPVKGLIKQKSALYQKLILKHVKTYPGVINLIKKLSKKYVLALATSSVKKEAFLTLNHFKVKDYFKAIVTADDITRGKPDPEPYLLAAKKLSLAPNKCVAIEDSVSGIISAKAAKMACIAITNTYPQNRLTQADVIVSKFSEINQKLIDSISSIKYNVCDSASKNI